jgi:hypothetical protein
MLPLTDSNNLLRSDTPKQLALVDVTDALNAPAIGSLLAHFPMAGGPRLNAWARRRGEQIGIRMAFAA